MSRPEINTTENAQQIVNFIRETDLRMRLMGMNSSTPFGNNFGGDILRNFEQEVLKGLSTLNGVLALPGMPKIYYAERPVLGVRPSANESPAYLDIITPTVRPDVLAIINYDPTAPFSLLLPNGYESQLQPLV